MPYQAHPHHRSQQFASQKSQWIISIPEEMNCYASSVNNNWHCFGAGTYYGLHLQGVIPVPLGTTKLPEAHQVHIAKFVSNNGTDWHGYPAAHWLSPYDKPDDVVLRRWFDMGFISMPKFRKIHGGKKCAL